MKIRTAVIILTLSFLHCGQRKQPELPRFIIHGNTFIYQNHPRSQIVYIDVSVFPSYAGN